MWPQYGKAKGGPWALVAARRQAGAVQRAGQSQPGRGESAPRQRKARRVTLGNVCPGVYTQAPWHRGPDGSEQGLNGQDKQCPRGHSSSSSTYGSEQLLCPGPGCLGWPALPIGCGGGWHTHGPKALVKQPWEWSTCPGARRGGGEEGERRAENRARSPRAWAWQIFPAHRGDSALPWRQAGAGPGTAVLSAGPTDAWTPTRKLGSGLWEKLGPPPG